MLRKVSDDVTFKKKGNKVPYKFNMSVLVTVEEAAKQVKAHKTEQASVLLSQWNC